MDNASIKALLLRGLVAANTVDEARKDLETNIEGLVKSSNTQRVVAGLFASFTPKAIEAGIQFVESLAPLYTEVSSKVAILQSALPALAEAIEKANEEKGVVSFLQFKEVLAEVKAEERAKNPPKKAKKKHVSETETITLKTSDGADVEVSADDFRKAIRASTTTRYSRMKIGTTEDSQEAEEN